MAPRAAARKARRIIESPSASSSEAASPPPARPSRAQAQNTRSSGGDVNPTSGSSKKRPLPPDDSEIEEESDDPDDQLHNADAEGEEEEAEDDVEGEEEGLESEEGEADVDMERSRLSSIMPSEDLDVDAEGDELDDEADSISPTTNSTAPASALKIRLKVMNTGTSTPTPAGRPGRVAGKKGSEKVKKVTMEELADSDDELLLKDDEESVISSRRSISPSKLTARQRAKGNKDLQETLLQLPNDMIGKKQIVLTEAEKLQRREETARRRKRQSEQKLQDEQDETINRLLRAQTSKSRSKLDNPSPALDGDASGSGQASPTRRVAVVPNGMIRWSSSLTSDGDMLLRVAAPKGKEDWIALSPSSEAQSDEVKVEDHAVGAVKDDKACAVAGCEQQRKYRSTKRFEVGGCSLQHLKAIEAGLS